MTNQARITSGDLTFDIAGHMLNILLMLAALVLIEALDRAFSPFDMFVFDRPFGSWDDLIYVFAFVVAYSGLTCATERLIGNRLDRLQSTVARSMPSGRRTNNGYSWLGQRLGMSKWAKRTLTPGIYVYLAIYAVVFTIIHVFFDGLRDGSGNSFYLVLAAFVGVYLTSCAVVAAVSVAAGWALDRRQSRSSSP